MAWVTPACRCVNLRGGSRRYRAELLVTFGSNTALHVIPYLDPSQQGEAYLDYPTPTSPNGDTEALWNDVENGPKPQAVHLTQLTTGNISGQAVCTLDFEIHAACMCCRSYGQPFVLSNRWSVAESMDANFFTTRTINGKMRLASATFNAEYVRDLVLPSLEDGFRRESIDYAVAADGLTVDYVVKDRQIYQAAPGPARGWKAATAFPRSTASCGDRACRSKSRDIPAPARTPCWPGSSP